MHNKHNGGRRKATLSFCAIALGALGIVTLSYAMAIVLLAF